VAAALISPAQAQLWASLSRRRRPPRARRPAAENRRSRSRFGSQRRAGAPDPALTPNAGLAVISELCDRLGVISALDAAVGPVKQRDRGFGAGELLCGIVAAQLAGEDFLTGPDRQRADAAGQRLTPVPGPASTTAAGQTRRVTPAQWRAVKSGLAAVTSRMLSLLPGPRVAALAGGPVTIDLDTTDVEVYGRKKRGVPGTTRASRSGARTWRPGPRPRSRWPLTWVTALMTRARPRRTCCAARWPPCLRRPGLPGGWRYAPMPGTSPGHWPRAAHEEKITFAIGAKRIAPLWPRIPAHQDHLRRQGPTHRTIRGFGSDTAVVDRDLGFIPAG
jgi:hypothetical protein